jgi:hypothetical protein
LEDVVRVKTIVDEVFQDYKLPAMYVAFPYCSWKCCKEYGATCHNSKLAKQPDLEIPVQAIVDRYLTNPITKAIILSGLEPLDSFPDVLDLVRTLRLHTSDDIVIFTGYREDEVQDKVLDLSVYSNIVVKFGRFIPDQKSVMDPILQIRLASPNQSAKRLG